MARNEHWKAETAKPRSQRRRCEECHVHSATPGYDLCWRCWSLQLGWDEGLEVHTRP